MRNVIRVLDQETIHKIAAGEVIENPASVVKELTDNAIDAGSASIYIEIQGGGLQRICVADDGIGMHREDVELSIMPHATSKITSIEDLEKVASMGFRGEALPSIAAISRMTITSAAGDTTLPLGTQLVVEDGKLLSVTEVARTVGTTVEVTDLFARIPVRKTFQKSPARSATDTLKMLTPMALSHPEIRMVFISEGKQLFATYPKEDVPFFLLLKQAIEQVLGAAFFAKLKKVEWERKGFKIRGYIGLPEHARAHRSGQFLILNKRVITSHLISQTIREAYSTRIASSLHPLFVLHLDLPKSWVDVNVHPQKQEVRFQKKCPLYELIREAVAQALGESLHCLWSLPPLPALPKSDPPAPTYRAREAPQEENVGHVHATHVLGETEHVALTPVAETLPVIGLFSSFLLVDCASWGAAASVPYLEKEKTSLLFVDLQGASMRLLYEELMQSSSHESTVQGLLTPILIECTLKESASIRAHIKDLAELGIVLRPLDSCRYALEGLAQGLDVRHMHTRIFELIESMEKMSLEKIGHMQKQKLALQLCRHASSRRRSWTVAQADLCVKQLLQTPAPYYTPTGIPIIGALTDEGIKNLFAYAHPACARANETL